MGCVGRLFIYFLSKIPETASKTKDMGLSVLHRRWDVSQTRAADMSGKFGKNPKVKHKQKLGPLKPEVTINIDSPVLTSILEVIKVKAVLCEKAELNWLQVIYNQKWLSFFVFTSSLKLKKTQWK